MAQISPTPLPASTNAGSPLALHVSGGRHRASSAGGFAQAMQREAQGALTAALQGSLTAPTRPNKVSPAAAPTSAPSRMPTTAASAAAPAQPVPAPPARDQADSAPTAKADKGAEAPPTAHAHRAGKPAARREGQAKSGQATTDRPDRPDRPDKPDQPTGNPAGTDAAPDPGAAAGVDAGVDAGVGAGVGAGVDAGVGAATALAPRPGASAPQRLRGPADQGSPDPTAAAEPVGNIDVAAEGPAADMPGRRRPQRVVADLPAPDQITAWLPAERQLPVPAFDADSAVRPDPAAVDANDDALQTATNPATNPATDPAADPMALARLVLAQTLHAAPAPTHAAAAHGAPTTEAQADAAGRVRSDGRGNRGARGETGALEHGNPLARGTPDAPFGGATPGLDGQTAVASAANAQTADNPAHGAAPDPGAAAAASASASASATSALASSFAQTLAQAGGGMSRQGAMADNPAQAATTPATPAVGAAGATATLPGPMHAAAAGRAALPERLINTPLGDPGFGHAMGVQVSMLARDGIQQARLHLNPAEMGPITVQIAMDGKTAQVTFHADMAATRSALESSLPALAGALQDAGLTLTGGGVSQQSPQGGQAQAGQGGQGQRPAPQDTAADNQGQMPTTGRAAAAAAPPRGLVDLVA